MFKTFLRRRITLFYFLIIVEFFSKELRKESKRLRRELRETKKAKRDSEEVPTKLEENDKNGAYF